MDAKRAAEALNNLAPWTHDDAQEACKLGAQALEAWAWVEREGAMLSRQRGVWVCLVGLCLYGTGLTPLAAVLDAMEKEKGNGNQS